MPANNPTGKGGTRFLPGKSGNPKGRPKTREDLKAIRLLSADDSKRLVQKVLDMSAHEIRAMVEDPLTPALEIMVAKIVIKAIDEGDPARLNFLFDRTVGKVLEKHKHEVVPVTYTTSVRADGSLIQEALREDAIDVEAKEPKADTDLHGDGKAGAGGDT